MESSHTHSMLYSRSQDTRQMETAARIVEVFAYYVIGLNLLVFAADWIKSEFGLGEK